MTAKILQFRDYERKPRTDADRLRDLAATEGPIASRHMNCIEFARTGKPIWPPEDMMPKEGA